MAVDPDGVVIDRSWKDSELVAWHGQKVASRVDFRYWGARFVTRHGRVAFTGSTTYNRSGPMVADVSTGELLAYAPIRDRGSAYSDGGHVTPKGFLDADTVLLQVAPVDFRTMELGDETWHLVAWHLDTGEFERLASGDTTMRGIAVAADVLAAGWDG